MKTLLIILLTLSCVGCSKIDSLQRVQKEYPNCEIRLIPGESYKYILRDECDSVWYVEDSPWDNSFNLSGYKPKGVELIK